MPSIKSAAEALARSHVEAWSNHDWDAARKLLAEGIHGTVTSPQPTMPKTDTVGIEDYMDGLIKFAEAVVPGSLELNGSIGDEHSALLLVTVKADFPGIGQVNISGGRCYLFNEDNKLASEQTVFIAHA